MKDSLDFIRGIVRPFALIALVSSYIVAVFIEPAAATLIKDPMLVVLGFYFLDRAVAKATGKA